MSRAKGCEGQTVLGRGGSQNAPFLFQGGTFWGPPFPSGIRGSCCGGPQAGDGGPGVQNLLTGPDGVTTALSSPIEGGVTGEVADGGPGGQEALRSQGPEGGRPLGAGLAEGCDAQCEGLRAQAGPPLPIQEAAGDGKVTTWRASTTQDTAPTPGPHEAREAPWGQAGEMTSDLGLFCPGPLCRRGSFRSPACVRPHAAHAPVHAQAHGGFGVTGPPPGAGGQGQTAGAPGPVLARRPA